MRIRPVFVTGASGVAAISAVLIVVFTTAPEQASPTLVALVWVALFLAAWSMLATVALLARQTLARAVWVTLPPAVAAIGLLAAFQRGVLHTQLLGGVIFATLVLCVIVWRKLNGRP